jgi:hypothetical protein
MKSTSYVPKKKWNQQALFVPKKIEMNNKLKNKKYLNSKLEFLILKKLILNIKSTHLLVIYVLFLVHRINEIIWLIYEFFFCLFNFFL